MTVGEKIKYIRTFRGMTQQQLGVAIGLSAKGADNRMAQYETNYRDADQNLRHLLPEKRYAGGHCKGTGCQPPQLYPPGVRLCRGHHADILLAG